MVEEDEQGPVDEPSPLLEGLQRGAHRLGEKRTKVSPRNRDERITKRERGRESAEKERERQRVNKVILTLLSQSLRVSSH